MGINRVEIKDFLVFKGEFATDFCPGVNVLIGANATGKTTLFRFLYQIKPHLLKSLNDTILYNPVSSDVMKMSFENGNVSYSLGTKSAAYIPEKDILEHAKGLLPFIEQKQTGFSDIYKDILVTAQDVPTNEQTETQKTVGQIISDKIGGKIEWVPGEGMYYTVRTDGTRIPFVNEASGYKKLGYLGLLVASGHLESGAVLFWDEPENSLNPELMPVLVEILLELQSNGVQIFLATHSGHFAQYFDVKRTSKDEVMFYNLYKDGETVRCNNSQEYTKLSPNVIEEAEGILFNAVVAKAMGINVDE